MTHWSGMDTQLGQVSSAETCRDLALCLFGHRSQAATTSIVKEIFIWKSMN